MRLLAFIVLLPTLASGTIYTTDGSQADVNVKIAAASAGDTVRIPPGPFTWGDSGAYVSVNKAITLEGAGIDVTTIQLSSTGPTLSSGTIRISAAGAVVRGFTVLAPAIGNKATPFSMSSQSGWRLTNVKYNATGQWSYFAYVSGVYGVIDHCQLIGGNGQNELVFITGPSNSWQTDSTLGTANATYIEDNVFSGQCYVCDANNNARAVVRYNTINASIKIDGHGINTNSARGVRHMEVYGNHWTASSLSTAIEIRGGSGVLFDNVSDYKSGVTVFSPSMSLKDYGYLAPGGGGGALGFHSIFQTLADKPLTDQIGVGKDPKVAASEPYYVWNNVAGVVSPGTLDWPLSFASQPGIMDGVSDGSTYQAGETTINLASWKPPTGYSAITIPAGNKIAFDVSGTRYYATIATSKNSTSLVLVLAAPGLPVAMPPSTAIHTGAQVQYQWQTGNPSATFTAQDIITADSDYFKGTWNGTFDGTSGVGRGTKSAMLAITPTKTGVGYWVTDEGSWNTTKTAGTSGQLYVWNGTSWFLKYTPYTYPHPLANDGPDTTPPTAVASTNTAGTELHLQLSEVCTAGPGGTGGVTVSASGGPVTATYKGGSGTSLWAYDFSRTIASGETLTWSYSNATGIKDGAGNYLQAVSGGSVSNLVPGTPPDVPAGVAATSVAAPVISWSASSGATSYEVQRSLNGSTGWTTIATPSASPYTDGAASPSTTYYYHVRATNANGSSAYSSNATATTPAAGTSPVRGRLRRNTSLLN